MKKRRNALAMRLEWTATEGADVWDVVRSIVETLGSVDLRVCDISNQLNIRRR